MGLLEHFLCKDEEPEAQKQEETSPRPTAITHCELRWKKLELKRSVWLHRNTVGEQEGSAGLPTRTIETI